MDKKLKTFISRIGRLGISMKLQGNFPWVYLYEINGKIVTEKFQGNHGFTIMFQPINLGGTAEFTDIGEIFKLIRKYK